MMTAAQYNSSLGYQRPLALAPTRDRVLDHDHGAFYSDLSRDTSDTALLSRDNSALGTVIPFSTQGRTPIHPVTHGALAVTCAHRTSRQHLILREVL